MLKRLAATVALTALFAVSSMAQTPVYTPDGSKIRIGTGGKSGNYYWAANEIAKRFSPDLFTSSTIVNTAGSLDNLRRLSTGEVDIAFSQADVANAFVIESPALHDTFSVLKVAYTEYAHIMCPTSSGWSSLSDLSAAVTAKKSVKLIVGPDGSGTAETWRIMRSVDGKLYDGIQRDPEPADYSSAHTVADSKDTCMLWVSGLNSNDMRSANALSIRTSNGKPSLRLISIDDPKMLAIKGTDGLPLYKMQNISPVAASNGKPSLYDNLIQSSGFFSSLDRAKLARVLEAIDDAQPTIWARVNPAGNN